MPGTLGVPAWCLLLPMRNDYTMGRQVSFVFDRCDRLTAVCVSWFVPRVYQAAGWEPPPPPRPRQAVLSRPAPGPGRPHVLPTYIYIQRMAYVNNNIKNIIYIYVHQ